MIFETERLIIRNYRDEDRPVFAAIGGNPQARTYNGGVLTPAESDSFIDKQIETIDRIGCGFAAVERKTDGAVVGDVGIRPVPDELPFGKMSLKSAGSSTHNILEKVMQAKQPRAGSTMAFVNCN